MVAVDIEILHPIKCFSNQVEPLNFVNDEIDVWLKLGNALKLNVP